MLKCKYKCKYNYKYVKFTWDQLLRDSFLHPPKYGTLPAEINWYHCKKLFQLLRHQQPRSFPPARRRTRSTVWGGCSVAWPSNIYIQDSYLYIYIWLIFEAPLTIKYCSQCPSKVISNVTFTEVLLNVTSTVISIYHVKNINCQIECHVKCFYKGHMNVLATKYSAAHQSIYKIKWKLFYIIDLLLPSLTLTRP